MESLFAFFETVDPIWVYCGLLCGSYLENIFPPIPGDTVVVFGAYLVGIGTLRFDLAFSLTTLGSVFGFMSYYWLGSVAGTKIMASSRWRMVSEERIRRAEHWFHHYGYWIIAANRFLSGTRSVISLTAGVVRLQMVKVLALALLSCGVWNFILIYAGYKVGENWEIVIEYISAYNKLMFAFITLVVLFMIGRKYINLRKSETTPKR